MCTYHGWTYDLKGALVGVPGFKEVYHEELDRENWGLIKAGQVDSYKGMIFATMDPEAPGLEEFLGEPGRMGLSTLAERGDEMVALGGVQRYTIPCNWKFAVDNVWDYYHPQLTHASASMSGYNQRAGRRSLTSYVTDHLIFLGEYGHVLGGPRRTPETEEQLRPVNPTLSVAQDETWRERPEAKQALGPVGIETRGHTNIFPNMWITQNQISMRMPKGPGQTGDLVVHDRQKRTRPRKLVRLNCTGRAILSVQPASWNRRTAKNWGQSTTAMGGNVSSKYPLH